MIAGAVLKAVSGFMQAKSGAKAEEYNAQIAERQAMVATQKAAYEEEMRREKGKKLSASQRAAAGATGITMGSFSDVFAQTALDTELDALAIRWGGQVSSGGYLAEAEGHRFAAKRLKTAGWMSLLGMDSAGQLSQIRGSQTSSSQSIPREYESQQNPKGW